MLTFIVQQFIALLIAFIAGFIELKFDKIETRKKILCVLLGILFLLQFGIAVQIEWTRSIENTAAQIEINLLKSKVDTANLGINLNLIKQDTVLDFIKSRLEPFLDKYGLAVNPNTGNLDVVNIKTMAAFVKANDTINMLEEEVHVRPGGFVTVKPIQETQKSLEQPEKTAKAAKKAPPIETNLPDAECKSTNIQGIEQTCKFRITNSTGENLLLYGLKSDAMRPVYINFSYGRTIVLPKIYYGTDNRHGNTTGVTGIAKLYFKTTNPGRPVRFGTYTEEVKPCKEISFEIDENDILFSEKGERDLWILGQAEKG